MSTGLKLFIAFLAAALLLWALGSNRAFSQELRCEHMIGAEKADCLKDRTEALRLCRNQGCREAILYNKIPSFVAAACLRNAYGLANTDHNAVGDEGRDAYICYKHGEPLLVAMTAQ